MNGSNPAFIDFIKDVDVLVVPLGGPENPTAGIAALHAKPSVWGQMASAANAGHLLVSHISTPSQDELDARMAFMRENYRGLLTIADDLMCIEVK